MQCKIISLFLMTCIASCNDGTPHYNATAMFVYKIKISVGYANTVGDILLPITYLRVPQASGDFGNFLRGIELNPDGAVYLFNGKKKVNQQAQFAVLKVPVGDTDLQQCADAIMRLRATFLFEQKNFEDIAFVDNAQTLYTFKEPYTKQNLEVFLKKVFSMCGTASLSKQLKGRLMKDIMPGDVLIRGGFPGHAVIVMDVAVNANNEKVFLLAQSYMPAQQIHILKNTKNNFSPWYTLTNDVDIITPEYHFKNTELKTW